MKASHQSIHRRDDRLDASARDSGASGAVDRDPGLAHAIAAAGGVGALARGLGIAQPSVSNWSRVPAERALAVEALTGVPRWALRPDLYPAPEPAPRDALHPTEQARADAYLLLARLLRAAPDQALIDALARLEGDDTPMGQAIGALQAAARHARADAVAEEYFALFIGVGRGELLPYASYYRSGFLNDRPLARLRQDLQRLGIERTDDHREPEDHAATLCEVMAGFALQTFAVTAEDEQDFFARHIRPWMERLFADLEAASAARFYRAVGRFGRTLIEIDREAFALPSLAMRPAAGQAASDTQNAARA